MKARLGEATVIDFRLRILYLTSEDRAEKESNYVVFLAAYSCNMLVAAMAECLASLDGSGVGSNTNNELLLSVKGNNF